MKAATYGFRIRWQALWVLSAQVAIVGSPGVVLGLIGDADSLDSSPLLSALVWTLPRILGIAGLWSVRKRFVVDGLPTRLLFRAGVVACWVPLVTALALLGGWGILALQKDPSVLMVTAELDNTVSNACLAVGFVTFGLGFWLGKPR